MIGNGASSPERNRGRDDDPLSGTSGRHITANWTFAKASLLHNRLWRPTSGGRLLFGEVVEHEES